MTTNKFQKEVFWWLKIMKVIEVIKPLLVQQTIFKVASIWIKHHLYPITIRIYRMIKLMSLNSKVRKVFLFQKEKVSMIVWMIKENPVEGINFNQLKFWTNNFLIINTRGLDKIKINKILMNLVIRPNRMKIPLLIKINIQDKN